MTPTGEAALVVGASTVRRAGKAYEAWVIEGDQPEPAGLFDGQDGRDVLRLDRPVPSGATVAVTLEDDRGAEAPTSDVLFSAQT